MHDYRFPAQQLEVKASPFYAVIWWISQQMLFNLHCCCFSFDIQGNKINPCSQEKKMEQPYRCTAAWKLASCSNFGTSFVEEHHRLCRALNVFPLEQVPTEWNAAWKWTLWEFRSHAQKAFLSTAVGMTVAIERDMPAWTEPLVHRVTLSIHPLLFSNPIWPEMVSQMYSGWSPSTFHA